MNTLIKFRINKDHINLLGTNVRIISNGNSYATVVLPIDEINADNLNQSNVVFARKMYYDWDIIHKYTDKEWADAYLFRLTIKKTIEPCGEECGTAYNDDACPICGAGRTQKGPLILSKEPSLGKMDICKTIAGEVIVSKRFQELMVKYNVQGMSFLPILIKGKFSQHVMQLKAESCVNVSPKTRFGIDCFDRDNIPYSNEQKVDICGHEITMAKEIYVCPNKDLLGLNLLSELYINMGTNHIHPFDFAKTAQYVGVKRGLLRPEPLYVCSREFLDIIKQEKITGVDFEIARTSEEDI